VTKPDHDPAACSLCTLLAKIKVGRLALYCADLTTAHSSRELFACSAMLPTTLDLTAAPRGPPLA
jgi:hypothetical protein